MKVLFTSFAMLTLLNISYAQTVDLLQNRSRILKSDYWDDATLRNRVGIFLAVYNEYSCHQHSIADDRLELIKYYAQNIEKLNDAIANELAQRSIEIDTRFITQRQDY